jgi:predicted DsbA family dithiol-disulfide isomerase
MNSLHNRPAATLLIDYYTDPLCRQSWAFEPCWRRLRAEFGHRFAWRYYLGGLLPHQATPATGQPRSSRLACLAVRCAEQQSPQAGDLYLRALRAAALCDGRDLAQPDVLLDISSELAAQLPGLPKQLPSVFNATIFQQHFLRVAATHAPAHEACAGSSFAAQGIPGLVLRRAGWPDQIITVNNQPYEVLLHALAQAAPDLFYVASLEEGGAG